MVKPTLIIKKRWFQIYPPKGMGNEPIGETYVAEPQQSVNKHVQTSLMTLTGDPSKQTVSIKLKIIAADGEALQTTIVEYAIIPSAVRKLMRKRKTKIEDSFVIKTSDGKIARIKPVLITKGKAKGSLTASLKQQCRNWISATCAKTSFEDLIKSMVSKKFQKGLASYLKTVYPLSISDVKRFSIVTSEKESSPIPVGVIEEVKTPTEKTDAQTQ